MPWQNPVTEVMVGMEVIEEVMEAIEADTADMEVIVEVTEVTEAVTADMEVIEEVTEDMEDITEDVIGAKDLQMLSPKLMPRQFLSPSPRLTLKLSPKPTLKLRPITIRPILDMLLHMLTVIQPMLVWDT